MLLLPVTGPIRGLLFIAEQSKEEHDDVTDSAVAHTNLPNSDDAGAALGKHIASTFKGERPDALILFASPTYDYPTLLQALDRACGPKVMVGCSSSGEFSTHGNHDGSACAVALRSSEIQFAAGLGRGLRGCARPLACRLRSW